MKANMLPQSPHGNDGYKSIPEDVSQQVIINNGRCFRLEVPKCDDQPRALRQKEQKAIKKKANKVLLSLGRLLRMLLFFRPITSTSVSKRPHPRHKLEVVYYLPSLYRTHRGHHRKGVVVTKLENRVPLVLVVEVLFVFVLLLRMLSTLKGNVTPYMPTHAPIVFGTAKVQNLTCDPCVIGKGHQILYGRDTSIRSGRGGFSHIDVCRPLSVQVINYLETQFSYKVKRIHGDNAAEHEPIHTLLSGARSPACLGYSPADAKYHRSASS
ncbi:hypothetical protein KXV66_001061 [Aspergillus fumigatus]|nr:hypothetical protein KXX38_007511 [Aspergillus fumigatus]KAH1585127.1 hypothetical protein KXX69_008860 [Aspergillus fumigatus]KAH1613454.1 hypothetical protein KXX31_004630 [Aspergillus fumigatus]KAH2597717.1 hypothetical protein KXV63_004908 [Aspergillus fumigatus]KAH2771763.1 hypothetical protein KXV66_001061 [Aspergillus fumigatus]